MKYTLAHIVNPYRAESGTEHHIVQPITLRSIQNAATFRSETYSIELYAAVFKGDESLVPYGFKTVYLNRSLQDVAGFKNARVLPLIADIIDLLKTNSAAGHFIYSNIDIGLQPYFYENVCQYLEKGYDSIVINRRGISDKYTSVDEISEMYKEIGKDHPGYDCFVFKNSLASTFNFKNICIGIPRFERVFVLNLLCFSEKILFLEQEKLTFHIGETIYKNWGDKQHLEHNESEYKKIRSEIFKDLRITKFPNWNDTILKRYWKWIWNPNFSFPDNFLLEWRYRMKGR